MCQHSSFWLLLHCQYLLPAPCQCMWGPTGLAQAEKLLAGRGEDSCGCKLLVRHSSCSLMCLLETHGFGFFKDKKDGICSAAFISGLPSTRLGDKYVDIME